MTQASPRRASFLFASTLAAAAIALTGCSMFESHNQLQIPQQSQGSPVKTLADLPNKDQSMLKVAEASRRAGDCAAAVRFYHLAESKGGTSSEIAAAHVGAAECELAMNDVSAARDDYETAAKLMPQDAAPLVGLGRVFLVEHQPNQAASYLDLALKSGAQGAYVWNDKGVALDQLHRHAEAQQAYRQGLTLYPQDSGLRSNLALSLAMSRDFPAAAELLRPLAAAPDASARTRQNLALVLGLEGDDAGARQVSEADLDGAALDNNARFYNYARARLTGQALPSPAAPVAAATNETFPDDLTPPPAQTALEPDLPPVLALRHSSHIAVTAEKPRSEATPAVAAAPLPAPAKVTSSPTQTASAPIQLVQPVASSEIEP